MIVRQSQTLKADYTSLRSGAAQSSGLVAALGPCWFSGLGLFCMLLFWPWIRHWQPSVGAWGSRCILYDPEFRD